MLDTLVFLMGHQTGETGEVVIPKRGIQDIIATGAWELVGV